MAPRRLVLRFALYAGVALLVAVAVGLGLARLNANARARDRALGDAKALAAQLGRDDLARTAFAWPPPAGQAGSDLLAFLDDFFSPAASGNDPAAIVLYSPAGTVTYATDRTLVGSAADAPGRVHAALSQPQYHVVGGVQRSDVPVTWTFAPGAARGVLEVRRDYAPVAAEIHDDFLFQAGAIALALLALYLAMLPIMRRVTGSLRRAYVERSQLAAIVDHSNDAIVGRDCDGTITTWNAGAERIYGRRAADAVGRPIDVLVPPERDGERFELQPEFDLTRTTHLRRDGTPIDVSVTISPVRDAAGGLVGSSMIARDVTELTRLEAELREAQRQEAVGRLAAGIANDFGELFAAIEDATESLLIGAPHAGQLPDLDRLRRATAHGSSLTDQLLAVGGGQEARPQVLDLNEAVLAVAARIDALAGRRVEVVTELDPGLGAVLADREQVEQLILNLAANARDAMPAGGRLTIATQNVDFARRGGARKAEGHFVMFSVADTGTGLSEETRSRPFEPFVRRGKSGDRLALGLAAVCGIVKQSGGTMGVESRAEGGTIVRVYLPRVGVSVPAAPS